MVFAAVTVEVIVSRFTIQIVVALIGGQLFRTVAVQLIGAVPTKNVVVAAQSEDNIVTFFAIQIVVPDRLRVIKSGVADNEVIAGPAIDFVVAGITGDVIIPGAAVDIVIAERIDNAAVLLGYRRVFFAGDAIVAIAAVNDVVTLATGNDVIADSAVEDVVANLTGGCKSTMSVMTRYVLIQKVSGPGRKHGADPPQG